MTPEESRTTDPPSPRRADPKGPKSAAAPHSGAPFGAQGASRWRWLATAAVIAFCLGPLLSQLVTSLRGEPVSSDANGAAAWSFANYVRVWQGRAFGSSLVNSTFVAAATTLAAVTLGSLAAFALAKLRFRGKGWLLGGALAISMFPPIATVSPLYLMMRAFGLRDTLFALVLSYTTFALPLAIFILARFFREIPDAIYDSARVDGCSPLAAWWRIGLPLAAPGVASTAILIFVFAYNEFVYALTFTSSPERRTVPVAISLFATSRVEPWGEIAAASIIAAVPLVAIAVLFQRRIVAALTEGAVKE
jgi:multiple sugar transport system permease protein